MSFLSSLRGTGRCFYALAWAGWCLSSEHVWPPVSPRRPLNGPPRPCFQGRAGTPPAGPSSGKAATLNSCCRDFLSSLMMPRLSASPVHLTPLRCYSQLVSTILALCIPSHPFPSSFNLSPYFVTFQFFTFSFLSSPPVLIFFLHLYSLFNQDTSSIRRRK